MTAHPPRLTDDRDVPPVSRYPDIACRPDDNPTFYPEDAPNRARTTAAAKRICRRCPHRDECLLWALETGQQYGVWGGMSATERRD